MAINLTDELNAATKKGKIASAKQVYLEGDQENLQQIGDKTHQLEQSIKDISATGGASTANAVSYSNETSGMTAVNAQAAIDELAAKNKAQDSTIATKADAADVTSKMQTEQTRVNAELDKKFDKDNISQESGSSTTKVMSQNAVSNIFKNIETNRKHDIFQNTLIYDTTECNTKEYVNENQALDTIPLSARTGYMIAFVRVNGVTSMLLLNQDSFSSDKTKWIKLNEQTKESVYNNNNNLSIIISNIFSRALGYKLRILNGNVYNEYVFTGSDISNDIWNDLRNWNLIASDYDTIKLECCIKKESFVYLDPETGMVTSGGNGSHCVSDFINTKNITRLKYTLESPAYDAAVIACYNNNKEYIKEKSLIFSAKEKRAGVFDIDSSVAYIRVYFIIGETSCVISPNKPYSYQEDLDTVTKETSKIKEDLEGIKSYKGNDVICFGDSLTEGAGSTTNKPSTETNVDVSFPAVLSRLINDGRTVVNAGCGGEPSWMVATRQGAECLLCEPFTMPAEKTKVRIYIKGQEQDFFYNDGNFSFLENNLSYNINLGEQKGINPCCIGDIEGTLSRELLSAGTPDPTTGETVQSNTYAYYFTRAEIGKTITFDRPLYIIGKAYREWRDKIQILWCGANDAPNHDGSYIIQPYDYKRMKIMTENLTSNRFIVMDLPTGNDISRASSVQEFNQLFGSHYLNIRKYVSKYGIDIANKLGANITSSESDKQSVLKGEVPSCLKIDGIHGNYWFYQVVALAVFDKGKSLGYW